MMRTIVVVLCALLVGTSPAQTPPAHEWLTFYEKSGYTRTPRYAETIEYCKRLDTASPWVKYVSFGISPQGRELPLVILSKDGHFEPATARRSGKAIILIQSGIHAGEIDGKDASLMLMREIAITKKLASLLDNTILLFVPIFNVDGHERFGPFNRINQNGPEEMGWRTTAQNLNLNRDYMKADAPEMRAMLRLFTSWLPDLYIDCHVTDGIDVQYDITYATETAPSIDAGISRWIEQRLLPASLPKVEAAGHKIFFYVFLREENDLSKGLNGGAASPRFSTGYGALQNRPTVLVETHMLKPYRTRVEATYHFLKAIIGCVNEDAQRLRVLVNAADEATARLSFASGTRILPIAYGLSDKATMVEFLGIESKMEPSAISGGTRTVYTGVPVRMTIPFYKNVKVTDSVDMPLAYLVPKEWTFVEEVASLHGIRIERLARAVSLEVESYRFTDVKFRDRPYEGRQMARYSIERIRQTRFYPEGTMLIRTNQRTGKVVAHLLEPKAPDSFVAWGFFNSIFEQKEYAEPYVMEAIGERMLAEDERLRSEFEHKVKTDTTFARSPEARLNWLYLRSKYADPWMNVYPIGRLVQEVPGLQTKEGR
ncbi:MAG TPA: M14 family metallopeptidase [Bacteroidota bacterium]|nr:M14 family metallopeptidase [Bacteroidota bacterium]